MNTPSFKNSLSQFLRNNPKISFDVRTEKFGFIQSFTDFQDLLDQLYERKVGVHYDENLFDDIPKATIDKLVEGGYFRKIDVSDKKSQIGNINKQKSVLFIKNYFDDKIDQDARENPAPMKLKDLWRDIQETELERIRQEKNNRKSGLS